MPAISQSRTATGSKSRYITFPIRESPQLNTAGLSWAGQWSSSQANPFSTTSDRPLSLAAHSYQWRRPATCRRSGVSPGKRLTR